MKDCVLFIFLKTFRYGNSSLVVVKTSAYLNVVDLVLGKSERKQLAL